MAVHESMEPGADRLFVVGDDRIAVGRLVTGRPERVQRERIDVGRRPLLFEGDALTGRFLRRTKTLAAAARTLPAQSAKVYDSFTGAGQDFTIDSFKLDVISVS
jgi:hypothetical protein